MGEVSQLVCGYCIRPPLSKILSPVCRVGKKKSQSGGRESFFFLISFCIN